MRFADVLSAARSTTRAGVFDGNATISVQEASALVDAMAQDDVTEATKQAKHLIASPSDFSSQSALALLQTAISDKRPDQVRILTEIATKAQPKFDALGGTTRIVRLSGNGGRPVAIYIPKGFDPLGGLVEGHPAPTLCTFFHGMDCTIAGSDGLLTRLGQLGSKSNAIYVIPQGLPSGMTSLWMKEPKESMSRLEDEVRAQLVEMLGMMPKIEARTVVAHSGGGMAVANLAGTYDFDKLVLLDAIYLDWAEKIGAWAGSDKLTHSLEIDCIRVATEAALSERLEALARLNHRVAFNPENPKGEGISHDVLPSMIWEP